MTIRPASDRSLLITLGVEPGTDAANSVAALTRSLLGVRGIVNLHPAFGSLLVDFDPRFHTHPEIEALVLEHVEGASEEEAPPARMIEIPVRFGGVEGPDLEDIARHNGLEPAQVVERFADAEYSVAFVG